MQGNYMMINDDTHTLCKGFDLNSIPSDWRKAALDIHLMVEVDRDKIPSFCQMTEGHRRYTNVYRLFMEVPFKKDIHFHRLSFVNEYSHEIHGKVMYHGSIDALVGKYEDQFRNTPVRDWPAKVKELSTSFSIKDSTSVFKYLK